MIKFKHLVLSTCFICAPAIAGQLMVSETLKVLEINGKEHNGGFLAKDTTFDIQPGEQKLLLKYQEFFEEDFENFATIRSKPFLFSFYANGDQDYQLATPELDNEREGKAFAKQPQVIITSTDAEPVASQVSMLSSTAPLTAPTVGTPSAAQQKQSNAKTPVLQEQSKQENIAISKQSPTALSMLTYWWQQASETERQAFLAQINQ
ncbi:DUF2057 domain-containing protein [Thalassotalea sp. LPB0316]|uniref:DUF2057 family protein n=1 Tax=Thalassotalea sp. LPB0316 TaxID=2769490 RepID=UPI001866D212|nr:DUF2057 family protein [Thalassotalea sp. LPB0316]QOL25003.1 DUF2057 domain-containing protein [Thalassotalea sp. LPB0316]